MIMRLQAAPFASKIFVKPIEPDALSIVATVAAKKWFDETFSNCAEKPKTLIVGHSLGGDTVTKSNNISADYRITIDPISRDLQFDIPPIYYQRPFTLPTSAPINENYLAEDISDEQRSKSRYGPDENRGFQIEGLASTFVQDLINGKPINHNTVALTETVLSGVTQAVQNLLPPQIAAAHAFLGVGIEESGFLDETWLLTAGGQALISVGDGSFKLSNISAPDQFGAGGPGTLADSLVMTTCE